jgi:hypothetical protein
MPRSRALQLGSLSWKGHAAPAKDSNKSAKIASGSIARHPSAAKASIADARPMLRDMNPREQPAGVLLTQRMIGFGATAARLRRFPDFGLSGHRRLNVAGNGTK